MDVGVRGKTGEWIDGRMKGRTNGLTAGCLMDKCMEGRRDG